MTPLYGHKSENTAYLVDDYPYGRKVRCRIRYWLETDAKKGVRFVSQTQNPKTLRWNAPKKSTYALIAGGMYLDDSNHVQWKNVTEYTNPDACLAFVRDFPEQDHQRILVWALKKAAFLCLLSEGKANMTIARRELERWKAVIELAKPKTKGDA